VLGKKLLWYVLICLSISFFIEVVYMQEVIVRVSTTELNVTKFVSTKT